MLGWLASSVYDGPGYDDGVDDGHIERGGAHERAGPRLQRHIRRRHLPLLQRRLLLDPRPGRRRDDRPRVDVRHDRSVGGLPAAARAGPVERQPDLPALQVTDSIRCVSVSPHRACHSPLYYCVLALLTPVISCVCELLMKTNDDDGDDDDDDDDDLVLHSSNPDPRKILVAIECLESRLLIV